MVFCKFTRGYPLWSTKPWPSTVFGREIFPELRLGLGWSRAFGRPLERWKGWRCVGLVDSYRGRENMGQCLVKPMVKPIQFGQIRARVLEESHVECSCGDPALGPSAGDEAATVQLDDQILDKADKITHHSGSLLESKWLHCWIPQAVLFFVFRSNVPCWSPLMFFMLVRHVWKKRVAPNIWDHQFPHKKKPFGQQTTFRHSHSHQDDPILGDHNVSIFRDMCKEIYIYIPSGYLLHSHGKSPF